MIICNDKKTPRDYPFKDVAAPWYDTTFFQKALTTHYYFIIKVAINIDQDVNLGIFLDLVLNNYSLTLTHNLTLNLNFTR